MYLGRILETGTREQVFADAAAPVHAGAAVRRAVVPDPAVQRERAPRSCSRATCRARSTRRRAAASARAARSPREAMPSAPRGGAAAARRVGRRAPRPPATSWATTARHRAWTRWLHDRLHHAPGAVGHVRDGRLDALARLGRRAWRCSSAAATRSTRRSAAGFVLQVVEPHLNGPGRRRADPALRGGGRASRGDLRPGPVAGRGDASSASRELGLDLVPGTGLLAACVPGAFDAWMLLLRDHGTMRLARGAAATRSATRSDGFPALRADRGRDRRRRASCSRPSGRPRRSCGCPRAATAAR